MIICCLGSMGAGFHGFRFISLTAAATTGTIGTEAAGTGVGCIAAGSISLRLEIKPDKIILRNTQIEKLVKLTRATYP